MNAARSLASISEQPILDLPSEDEGSDPVELLAYVADYYKGKITVSTSLGPQTLVIVDMLAKAGVSVPVFYLDTGLLFRETYELADRVRERYGIELTPVRPRLTVFEQAHRLGPVLWERNPDLCCHLRKVEPLAETLHGMEAWITGLRRGHGASRSQVQQVEWDEKHGLVKVNPLAFWSREQVQAWLRDNDVPYNPLLDRGYRSVGCWPCTQAKADSSDERAGRWAGLAKTECGMHTRLKVINTPVNY